MSHDPDPTYTPPQQPAKVYVIIAESCRNCNRMSIALRSTLPDAGAIEAAKGNLGRMHCIATYVHELTIDGDPVDIEKE